MVSTIHKHYQLYMLNILDKDKTRAYNRKQESPTTGFSACLKKHNVSLFLSSYKDGIYLKHLKGNAGVALQRYPAIFCPPTATIFKGNVTSRFIGTCLHRYLSIFANHGVFRHIITNRYRNILSCLLANQEWHCAIVRCSIEYPHILYNLAEKRSRHIQVHWDYTRVLYMLHNCTCEQLHPYKGRVFIDSVPRPSPNCFSCRLSCERWDD